MNWRVSLTDFRNASVVTVVLINFENERVENLELLFRDVTFTFRAAALKRESKLWWRHLAIYLNALYKKWTTLLISR